MAEIQEFEIKSHELCPSCGSTNDKMDENGLFRIDCATCGGNIVFFGPPRTVQVDTRTELHEDGSATVHMVDM